MSVRIAAQTAEQAGWRLCRAIPRGPGHLLVELGATDGTTTAGQWFDDRDRAAHVAEGTRRASTDGGRGAGSIRLIGGHLLLQPDGFDRRLPALRRLLRRPGADLIAHRPERRGVVRHPAALEQGELDQNDGCGCQDEPGEQYSKVVRPDRLAAVVAGIRGAGATGMRTPHIVRTAPAAGVVTTRAMPGATLHTAMGGVPAGRTALDWVDIGTTVGATIGRLHRGRIPTGARHDADAELAVSHRWLDMAAANGVLHTSDPAIAEAMKRAETVLRQWQPPVTGPVHRDLHDKQVLLTEGGDVGVLDLDLLAGGDPALDLANLLVHLELRMRQGVTTRSIATGCAVGVLAGYRGGPGAPSDRDWSGLLRRIPGYAWATRARLTAVYAFRPPSAAAARLLVTDPSPLIADLPQ